jgi:enoyl-[acyl-carrier protein] reductase / trans-2-enoyl-CoA reductase (NAD+)
MIIQPKVRGFICTNAHPQGCAANVDSQIAYVRQHPAASYDKAPKKVLVIGASTGYGLASRITAAFGYGAATLGVFFEKPPTDTRTASPGYYNSAAFHKRAAEAGLYARSINGDAFSDEIKQTCIDIIKADLGSVDLVIYSLASPRRQHPKTGVLHSSTLKPIGKDVTQRGIDTDKGQIKDFSIPAASQEEIDNTVAVMGGEDWQMWIDALDSAGVLAPGAQTTAFTYLGDRVTWDIYWHGTIGAAKKDLDKRVVSIRQKLEAKGGDARVSVLKAVVTQASSAIPVMPLYLSLLFKVMKADGTHEGCIEQLVGLFGHCLYGTDGAMDAEGRWRMDGKELEESVQRQVEDLWSRVTDENLNELSDYRGYQSDFLRLFGFGWPGVDYSADSSPLVDISFD